MTILHRESYPLDNLGAFYYRSATFFQKFLWSQATAVASGERKKIASPIFPLPSDYESLC